jgi:tellurite resistance-related uncharacterized protein
MTHDIPAGLNEVRRTPVFTATTTPAGLLSQHSTSVWAQLHVLVGSVDFFDEESSTHVLIGENGSHVIIPDRRHHVQPSANAEFYIAFFGDQSAPDEDVTITLKKES